MSFNVLVIPEDFRKDQFILKPLFERMFEKLGLAARVRVCMDPLLGGVERALDFGEIRSIVASYREVHLFVLAIDRDGDEHRHERLSGIEKAIRPILGSNQRLLGEHAWQEIEVWLLAGHDLPREWSWNAIRGERNVKEVYYEEFARARGVTRQPGGGRATLGRDAARRYERIRQLCPEIAEFESRALGTGGLQS